MADLAGHTEVGGEQQHVASPALGDLLPRLRAVPIGCARVSQGQEQCRHDEVGIPAAERRLPGPDGLPMDVEIGRWNMVGPRYGLEVVGPPLPEDV